jgi:hypothetical protein
LLLLLLPLVVAVRSHVSEMFPSGAPSVVVAKVGGAAAVTGDAKLIAVDEARVSSAD